MNAQQIYSFTAVKKEWVNYFTAHFFLLFVSTIILKHYMYKNEHDKCRCQTPLNPLS